jgi:hypothetical protein
LVQRGGTPGEFAEEVLMHHEEQCVYPASSPINPAVSSFPRERYLTVHQVAIRYNLSDDTIRRRFEAEPGVIIITLHKPRKRIYRTLRIPESVVQRVFARWTIGGRP